MAKDLGFTAITTAHLSHTSKKDEALNKLIAAWNSKNAQAGKRVGTFGFMAAALAACGGSGTNNSGNVGGTDDEASSFRLATGSANQFVLQSLNVDLATAKDDTLDLSGLVGLQDPAINVSNGLMVPAGKTYVGDISLFNAVGGQAIAVSGAGNLWIIAPNQGFVAGEQTVRLDVSLDGGQLTFDMETDNVAIRIDDQSSVDLNGGTLRISDGDVQVSAATFASWDVGNLIVNSRLVIDLRGTSLSNDQLSTILTDLDAVTDAGNTASALRLLLDDDAQTELVFDALEENNSFNSGTAPKIEVENLAGDILIVDLEALIDSKIAFTTLSLERKIDALEAQVTGDTEGLDPGVALQTLVELSNALAALQAATGGASGLGARLAATEAKLAGVATTVTTEIEAAVDALEAQVTGDTEGLDPGVALQTLVELSNALASLQAATSGEGGLEARLTAAEDKLAGITNTVIKEITSSVNGLKQQIEGEGFDTATLRSLAELSAAIETLRGDDLTEGSIKFAISEALGDEPAFDDTTDRFIVQDLGDNQTVGNALAELMNMAFDYTDTAIDALEGLGEGSWAEGDYQTLSALNAAVQALETSLGEGSVTVDGQLASLKTTLESYADSAVSALETKLSGGLGEGDYATLKDLSDAVVALEGINTGDASTPGTVAFRLAGVKSDLEAYTDAEITALKATLEGLGEGSWVEGDYQTLSALNAAVQALETSLGEGSVSDQLASLRTTLEAYADNAVTALETKLSGSLGEGDYATLKELSDAVVALQGASSGDGGLEARLAALEESLGLINSAPQDWNTAFTGENADNVFTVAEIFGAAGESGSSTVQNSFVSTFASRIDGYDPSTVPLSVTGDLTVAQAVALADAGLQVNSENVTYTIRDAYTSIQSALTSPDANAAMVGATEVVAYGNSNPNSIDMMAFGPSINLRIDSGAGDDVVYTGAGDHTIYAGLGSDTVWLTPTADDSSDDTVAYQTVYDGTTLPITALTLSDNVDNYREGSVLTVQVNGAAYQYTTVAGDTIASALQGFATAIEAASDVSGVVVKDNVLEIFGATSSTKLTVVTDSGSEDTIVDIANPGLATKWSVSFSSDAADWPTQTNSGNTTVFERELSVTIDGDTIRADVAYDENGVVDTAQSVQNLVDAINEGGTAAEVRLAVSNGDQSYTSVTATGTVTVNGITYDLPETASSLADLAAAINAEFGQRTFARTGEIVVNTFTKGNQDEPDIIALSDGGFLITYYGPSQDPLANFTEANMNDSFFEYEIWAQRFDADGNKVGDEFQINARVEDDQDTPSVTQLSNGNLVFVWESQDGDTTTPPTGVSNDSPGDGIGDATVARIFDMSTDTPTSLGDEFVVNQKITSNQDDPHVAALSNGGFVVVWEDSDKDGDGDGVFARVFDASGSETVAEYQVNTTTTGEQSEPKVVGYNGGFIVAWEASDAANDDHVAIQNYDNNGAKLGGETNIVTGGSPAEIEMATLPNGKVAISWTADSEVASRAGARDPFFTIFDPDAPDAALVITNAIVGQEEMFGTVHTGEPSVSALSDGGFVVVFEDLGDSVGGDENDVWARQFNADGTPRADAFQLNTTTGGDQDSPVSAGLLDGGFVVSWEGAESPNEVFARVYNGPVTRAADLVASASIDPETGELVIKTSARGPDQSITFDGEITLLDGESGIGGVAQTIETATGTETDNYTAVVSSSGQTVIEITGAAVPATDIGAPTFTVDSAAVDQNGTQQQTTVSFSSNDADYYEGGTLSVEISGVSVTANMVAGDAAASVQALASAVENALTGAEPAVVRADAGGLTLASVHTGNTNNGWGGLVIDGQGWTPYQDVNGATAVDGVTFAGVNTLFMFSAGTALADLIDHFNAQFAGVATMALTDGSIVISTVATGPDASIGNFNKVSFNFYESAENKVEIVFQEPVSGGYNTWAINPELSGLESVEQTRDGAIFESADVARLSQGGTLYYALNQDGSFYVLDTSLLWRSTAADAPTYRIDATLERVNGFYDQGGSLIDTSQDQNLGYVYFEGVDSFIASLKANGAVDGAPITSEFDVAYNSDTGYLAVAPKSGGAGFSLSTANLTIGQAELGTGLTLTAATEATDPLSATGTLSYEGEYQRAAISLNDAATYNAYSDGTDVSARGRGADVYFEGGKVYATITGVGADATLGTADDAVITVSADMQTGEPLRSYLSKLEALDFVASAKLENGEFILSFEPDVPQVLFMLGGTFKFGDFEFTENIVLGGSGYPPVSGGYRIAVPNVTLDSPVVGSPAFMQPKFTIVAADGSDAATAQALVDAIQAEIDGADGEPAVVTLDTNFADGATFEHYDVSNYMVFGYKTSADQSGFNFHSFGTWSSAGETTVYNLFHSNDSKFVARYAFYKTTYSDFVAYLNTIDGTGADDKFTAEINDNGDIVFTSTATGEDAYLEVALRYIYDSDDADQISDTKALDFGTFYEDNGLLASTFDYNMLAGISDVGAAASAGSLDGIIDSVSVNATTGEITLTAATPGRQTFEVSDVRLDYEGVKQIATFDASQYTDGTAVTYFAGGSLDLTIQATDAAGNDTGGAILISADMVDGEGAASVDALVAAIQAEIDGGVSAGEAAIVALPETFETTEALIDTSASGQFTISVFIDHGAGRAYEHLTVKPHTSTSFVFSYGSPFDGGVTQVGIYSSGDFDNYAPTAGDFVSIFVAIPALADLGLRLKVVNGKIVAESSDTDTLDGTSSSVTVGIRVSHDDGGVVAPENERGPGPNGYFTGVGADGTPVAGALAGIVGSVSETNGVITLTSADNVSQQFYVSSATAEFGGTKQTAELGFATNARLYYTGGKIYATVEGQEFSADMVAGKPALTVDALANAIRAAGLTDVGTVTRDGTKITIEAASASDSKLIEVADIKADIQAVTQVTEVRFTGLVDKAGYDVRTDDSTEPHVYAVDDNGDTGTISITIAGVEVVADMADTVDGTAQNLADRIIAMRDGVGVTQDATLAGTIGSVELRPYDVSFVQLTGLSTFVGGNAVWTANAGQIEAGRAAGKEGVRISGSIANTDGQIHFPMDVYATIEEAASALQGFLRTETGDAALTVVYDDAAGTVTIDGTASYSGGGIGLIFADSSPAIIVTAKDGGADPLQISGYSITTPYIDPVKHEITLQFSNSYLDGQAIAGETISVTMAGVTSSLEVTQALLDQRNSSTDPDQSEYILGQLVDQIIADHQALETPSGLDLTAAASALEAGNLLRFMSGGGGVGALGDVVASVTQDDGTATNPAAVLLETVVPGYGEVAASTSTSGVTVYAQGARAVKGANEYTASSVNGDVTWLSLNDEVTTGIASGDRSVTITNAGTGEGDDSSFFGDASMTGSVDGEGVFNDQGVKQTFTNPGDDYTALDASPQLDGEGVGEGDNTLYGSDPGVYDDDGLLTSWLNGETPTETDVDGEGTNRYTSDGEGDLTAFIDVDATVSTGAASTTSDLGEGDLVNDRTGFAGFNWDDAITTLLTNGNAGPDIIHNFQVGEGGDVISLEAGIASSTNSGPVTGTVASTVLIPSGTEEAVYMSSTPNQETFQNLTNVSYIFGDVDFSNPFEFTGAQGLSITVDTPQIKSFGLSQYQLFFKSTVGERFENVQELEDYWNSNFTVNIGDPSAVPQGAYVRVSLVDEVPQDYQDARFVSFSGNGIKVEVSTDFVMRPAAFGVVTDWERQGSAFDLSSEEVGLVTSDESSLSSVGVTSSADVAALLNSVFDFSSSDNGSLYTTIFAVTASDDESVTAIWAHQQSSAGDSTVEALELYHLATVNTIGGEFELSNFGDILVVQAP